MIDVILEKSPLLCNRVNIEDKQNEGAFCWTTRVNDFVEVGTIAINEFTICMRFAVTPATSNQADSQAANSCHTVTKNQSTSFQILPVISAR
jgi:hypothetical protein